MTESELARLKRLLEETTKERTHALANATFWRAAFNKYCGPSTWPLNKNGKVEIGGVEFHPPTPFGTRTKQKDGTFAYVITEKTPRIQALKRVDGRKSEIEDDEPVARKPRVSREAAPAPTVDKAPTSAAEMIEELREGLKG